MNSFDIAALVHFAGVALNSQQASISAATVSPGAQLHSPVVIQQQPSQLQQGQPPPTQVRFQQVHQQQPNVLYSPQQLALHQQQIRVGTPTGGVPPHQIPQQHPIEFNQQIRQQGGFAGGPSAQQQPIHQQLPPRMVHPGGVPAQVVQQQQQQEMKVQFFGHEPHVNGKFSNF